MKILKLIFITIFCTIFTIANAASLDAMIGQMVLVGFQGKDLNSKSAQALVKDVKAGKVGGVLFLGHNVGSKKQVLSLTNAIQSASSNKILITIDQEGGRVRRIKEADGAPFLASAKQMTQVNQQLAHEKYYDTAFYLNSIGFNVNFGPVVDLEINKNNPVIAKLNRSYGANPLVVSQYAYMFVNAHRQANMLTALKHFPGHGSSAKDSHKGFVNISKTWQAIELDPYKQLIIWDAADMVMAAHVFLDKMSDDGKVPTSLSHKAITGVLRGELKFKGVVVSDDMAMGAITRNFTSKVAIIKSINAGTDLVMMSFNKDKVGSLGAWVHGFIKHAVANGQIKQQTIVNAYNRIQILKAKLP